MAPASTSAGSARARRCRARPCESLLARTRLALDILGTASSRQVRERPQRRRALAPRPSRPRAVRKADGTVATRAVAPSIDLRGRPRAPADRPNRHYCPGRSPSLHCRALWRVAGPNVRRADPTGSERRPSAQCRRARRRQRGQRRLATSGVQPPPARDHAVRRRLVFYRQHDYATATSSQYLAPSSVRITSSAPARSPHGPHARRVSATGARGDRGLRPEPTPAACSTTPSAASCHRASPTLSGLPRRRHHLPYYD